ncbi:hypothetical protein CTheo_1905 [Ceratobasidium theobromae]|uniref:Uncharacterized protein n=1 Tax=Ceratobasidium theobromae TaxID=1582974 RepID=A0A5N5QSN4_9AGAM|nr:hypothetical protein CTheo_1905 [Ceratobasidium theobromae]
MSTIPLLPEEISRQIFYYATLTTLALPLSSAHFGPTLAHPFEYTLLQRNARALGLATRRNLNQTSRSFHSLVEEFLLEDVTLESIESVNEFAAFISRFKTGWWVRKLKIRFATQWSGSIVRPAHANGVARILASCPRLIVYEDALFSGTGRIPSEILAGLVVQRSLRAIGWTGETYPSTTDVQTLVEALPDLDTLYLQGCNPGTRDTHLLPLPSSTPVCIPSLQSLTLRLAEIRGVDILPFLITAHIPSLTHLTLVGTFHFGGNVAANTVALREFFKIHGPQLQSLDIRDDDRFAPAGPLVEFLTCCTKLKKIIYPVSWAPPLCTMGKVETVGLRTVTPDLLSACFESGQVAHVALEYLDAHLEVLVDGSLPKLKTIQFLDDEMLGGYPQLEKFSPHVESYLTKFHARCAKSGITTVDSLGVSFSF